MILLLKKVHLSHKCAINFGLPLSVSLQEIKENYYIYENHTPSQIALPPHFFLQYSNASQLNINIMSTQTLFLKYVLEQI